MNWIWILILLYCCNNGRNDDDCGCRNDMIQPRRERKGYPRSPFAPDCDDRRDRDRDRDYDCGCRASEMEMSETADDCKNES
ncbi:MAG: hypothetical protein E7289_02520 [Lachnospiraceae bacterium]|nr:hypothetical protein [Lachnospiraceae bacterium]